MDNKDQAIKIAMLDLNHMTLGVHTNTVPLGIGLISYYLKKNVEGNFDIKLFKDHKKLFKTLREWTPDIVGITQYSWNTQLNLYATKKIKGKNPNCLVIAGGPNLYLNSAKKSKYLKEYTYVDICVEYDGEIPFAKIVQRYINGEKINDIKATPSAGTYSINPKTNKLVESNEAPPKLKTLDAFETTYADGTFDEFFDDGFLPFMQTQRGCPFKCTYCQTSDDYFNKIIFQSPEIFKNELEYVSKRFKGDHNIPLYLANTNFGLYKEDIPCANVIREMQDTYDWPKNIRSDYGKQPDKLLKLFSIWKYKMLPIISLQTLTPEVLKNIKRRNIPYEDFVNFQKEVTRIYGGKTATELILSLPGETKESFLKTLYLVLNSGVQNIVTYTFMSLNGTPLCSDESIKKYGHVIKYRIVPRCFTEVNGDKIFDPEKVVIETNTMSFEDYLFLRGLSLIITTFASSIEFFPIRRFMMEHNLDIADWIFKIHNDVTKDANIQSVYDEFIQETRDELFDSFEDINEFYNKEENFQLLKEGKLGDNLLRKYKTIMLSENYKNCLQMALSKLSLVAENSFEKEKIDSIIKDFENYLNTRDIGSIFIKGSYPKVINDVTLNHDIPSWIENTDVDKTLNDFKGEHSYKISVTDYMKKRLLSFNDTNKDISLSLQIFYRDGYIEDFWPQWVLKK